jgi:hypothetical protein
MKPVEISDKLAIDILILSVIYWTNKLLWFDGSIYILVTYTTGYQICE